jgi:hypothetical protein
VARSVGYRTQVPLPAAAEELSRLAVEVAPAWRLEHWRSKGELKALHRATGQPQESEWTDEKRAPASPRARWPPGPEGPVRRPLLWLAWRLRISSVRDALGGSDLVEGARGDGRTQTGSEKPAREEHVCCDR